MNKNRQLVLNVNNILDMPANGKSSNMLLNVVVPYVGNLIEKDDFINSISIGNNNIDINNQTFDSIIGQFSKFCHLGNGATRHYKRVTVTCKYVDTISIYEVRNYESDKDEESAKGCVNDTKHTNMCSIEIINEDNKYLNNVVINTRSGEIINIRDFIDKLKVFGSVDTTIKYNNAYAVIEGFKDSLSELVNRFPDIDDFEEKQQYRISVKMNIKE